MKLLNKSKGKRLEYLLTVEDPVFEDNPLVDFCTTMMNRQIRIYRKELEALREMCAESKPEDLYKADEFGFVRIKKGHITYLNLDHHNLWNLPKSIGNLIALEQIYLKYNCLTCLPDSIENCKELKSIYIHGNPMTRNSSYMRKLKKQFPEANIIYFKQ